MPEQKPKARIYVTDDLIEGGIVSPTRDQAHYLSRVMRLAPGDVVTLFNGRHGEWRGVIDSVTKKSCTLALVERMREQSPAGDLWLAFAPLKKNRTDFLVEKATELGVGKLIAVFTDHTDTGRVNTDRLKQVSLEAAEQCERLSVPEISGPDRLPELLADWPEQRVLLIADETGSGQPINQALTALRVSNDVQMPSLGLLIGPEGGFSRAELDALAKLPFSVFVGLGPRILRAETAALAALACIQSLVGDWNSSPGSG